MYDCKRYSLLHPIPSRWHIDEERQFGTSSSSLDLFFYWVDPLAEFSTATVKNMARQRPLRTDLLANTHLCNRTMLLRFSLEISSTYE